MEVDPPPLREVEEAAPPPSDVTEDPPPPELVRVWSSLVVVVEVVRPPSPEQAEVVRQIFDSFLAGRSVRMIKKELEGQGVPSAKGGTVWSESAIRNILKNTAATF